MNLEIRELTKHYGQKRALQGVSMDLTPGIYGILGPNGAGKSTLMNLLTGNLKPTGGTMLLDGQDLSTMGAGYRSRLGYCPQQQSFYPGFTAEQLLFYMASLHGMTRAKAAERVDWALGLLSLGDVRRKRIRSFSGGMKQRLLIAQSLLHDPDILILDEPTAGLDPRQRIAVRNLIGQIAQEKIVLISTHVVQDVEHIARELILLSDGKILRRASARELLQDLDGQVWQIPLSGITLEQAGQMGTVCGVVQEEQGLCVRLLCDQPPAVPGQQVWPNLEDVYLHYFGGSEVV